MKEEVKAQEYARENHVSEDEGWLGVSDLVRGSLLCSSVTQVTTRGTLTGVSFTSFFILLIDTIHVHGYWPALTQVCCVIEKL